HRIQADRIFVVPLLTEDVEPVTDECRRGVAAAYRHLPLLRQLLGPRLRRREADDLAVAIGPAPLRPVGREQCARRQQADASPDKNPIRPCMTHGRSGWMFDET